STEKKRVVDLGSATPPTGGLDEVEDAHIQEDNQDDDNVEENSSNHFRKNQQPQLLANQSAGFARTFQTNHI
uniref:Uncharacterized protein n=1 Tax=Naja naja TaxID=35670 RepID=A0A8C6XKT4_NAJNA